MYCFDRIKHPLVDQLGLLHHPKAPIFIQDYSVPMDIFANNRPATVYFV